MVVFVLVWWFFVVGCCICVVVCSVVWVFGFGFVVLCGDFGCFLYCGCDWCDGCVCVVCDCWL